MQKKWLFVLLIVIFSLTGCQRASQQDNTADFEMSLFSQSTQVGETVLVVTLTEADGSPITNATLIVRGDMTHAGMTPVLRDGITENTDGVYEIPFEWTMGGDWVVTVDATLPDGRSVTKDFNMTIGE
ncbi:MAG: hypothetical protein Kow0080_37210 [Candidatus Promineifilaceae bacterium]